MRTTFLFLIGIIFLLSSACRSDFFPANDFSELDFSKDTVFLDTVFSTISSSTYGLKVYNRTKSDINIPQIYLGRNESFYRISVDGRVGNQFQNIPIRAKDSIYVFIEATIDYEAVDDPLYIDSLVFSNGASSQHVQLITLVKDAHFLFQSESDEGLELPLPVGFRPNGKQTDVFGFQIDNIETFTSAKPYVIYGYGILPENQEVLIESGATFYFHSNSGLVVPENTMLNIEGSLDEKVVFQGNRLEPFYEELPGQWTGIWFQNGSAGGTLENVIIKNAITGIYSGGLNTVEQELSLHNLEIYNCSRFGLIGDRSHIKGSNMVINNCGESSLAIVNGGSYTFLHSTFANYWQQYIRQSPAVYVSNFNYLNTENTPIGGHLNLLDISNCLIEGNRSNEIEFEQKDAFDFNFFIDNSLVRFEDISGENEKNPFYDFSNPLYYSNILLNQSADFKNPQENNFQIGLNSAALANGKASTTLLVPIDLNGVTRVIPADLGAYRRIDFDN